LDVLWSHEALKQLIGIESFIAKDSPDRAAQFVVKLITHAEATLGDQPYLGRIVPEISNQVIRELLFKGYRVIYKLNPDSIEVLTVFEGHRMLRVEEILP
jgi:toxin ParE1/3/4